MNLGPPLTLLGLATAATGTFALPLNDYDDPTNTQYGFVEIHAVVSFYSDHGARGDAYSGLAQFWWGWGVFLAFAVLLAAVLAMAASPATRWLGWVVAGLGAAAGIVHLLAMEQSVDYRSFVQFAISGHDRVDTFDHAGSGVWVSLVGFALVVVSGVVAALIGRPARPAAPPVMPPPPPPAPDALRK